MGAGREARAYGDGWVTPAFAALVAIAGALLLWEGRGTTYFNFDDISQFYALSWSPSALLEPLNGHLILVSRLLFHVVSSVFGADYAVMRVLDVAAVLAVDVVFFALARRLVAPPIALAASIPVLFLGTAWEAILWPSGALAMALAIAAGLGAFLALQSSRPRRDLIACGLLILSLASFSIGLCFAAGVAVWILIGEDRRRRAWVFVVPLALWGAWWLWARKFGETELMGSRLPHLPSYYWQSLEYVVGAATGVTGLGGNRVGFDAPPLPSLNIAPELAIVALIAAGALLWRRRAVPRELWPPLVALLTFWTLTGLALGVGRGPQASRYMLAGVVLLLLVVLAAARGASLGRAGTAALFAGAAVMAALNLVVLQRAHDFFTDYSTNARAQFSMLELAGANAKPDFDPAASTPKASSLWVALRTADYLAGVARYGSPADPLASVRSSSTEIRERADQVLAAAIGLKLRPARAPGAGDACRTLKRSGGPIQVRIPPGGVLLRADATSVLFLGRFAATPTAPVGFLGAGKWEALSLPGGRASRGWTASPAGARLLTACLPPRRLTGR